MSRGSPPEFVNFVTVPVLRAAADHAMRCFPLECCGYITDAGVVECTNAQASGVHPTVPDRRAETGFVIAGAELLAFARSFDGPMPARVVYHSHTNGRAYFSEVDRDVADGAGYPVLHLVIGVDATGPTEAALFDGAFVEIARWPREVLR
jgi:proteasome lid subunit RPN8/RPN11